MFVVLVTQHAMRMRHACPALQNFSTLSHERHDFRNRVTEHKMCVLTHSTILSEKFLILRITEQYLIKFYIVRHVKYLLFLSDISKIWIFSTYFRKVFKYQISQKSYQWKPSCSMRRDGRTGRQRDRQTDLTKLIVAFRNFANAPKNTQFNI